MNNTIKVILGVAGALLLLLILSIDTVSTGNVGIRVRFGAVQNDILTEGLHFKVPFIESIKKMDCRTQRVDIEGEGASKDLQTINTYIVVNYRIVQEEAFSLYKTVGKSYEEIIIRPAVQETMKTTLAKYTAEELITKREKAAIDLQETLEAKLKDRGIIVENASIVNLTFSEAYDQAIEAKQVAEQEVKKAQQELEKAKIEAERKVVEAQAEAEALKAQRQEITDDLLKLKWIEKWNGVLPATMLGDSSPLLSISK